MIRLEGVNWKMWNKYTIELRTLLEDEAFEVFSFDYDFYTDDPKIRAKFEQKFKDHYLFDEICCETVARWKHMLKSKLNMMAPYYKQLYQTELKSQNIEFLLNKDLREEFERTVEGVKQSDTTSTSSGSSAGKSSTDSKVSNLDNGVSEAKLSSGYLTGVSNDTSSNSTNNQSNATNQNKETDKQTEKTILVSQGNIGTTSSAELLERWRDVLINIDQMIIDDCKDLFMLIY